MYELKRVGGWTVAMATAPHYRNKALHFI